MYAVFVQLYQSINPYNAPQYTGAYHVQMIGILTMCRFDCRITNGFRLPLNIGFGLYRPKSVQLYLKKLAKFICGLGSALDPTGGAYDAHQVYSPPLANYGGSQTP